MANTTLVNVDEQTAPKLVSFISSLIGEEEGKSQSFLETGNALIEKGDTNGLIEHILGQSEKIIAAEIESDIVGCFQAVISIMFSLESEGQVNAIIEKIIACLTGDTVNKNELRLKILVCVFNMLVTPVSKLAVLKATFKYCLASGLSSMVCKFHDKIDYWVTEWTLNTNDKRDLYQLISDLLSESKQDEALIFLVKYLDTFAGQAYPADVEIRTIDAVLSAIRSPVASYRDRSKLYETLAKQQFGNSDLGKLVELLRILCVDSLESYHAYKSSNAALMATHKIDGDEVTRSMKLLTLCTLGSQIKKLPYANIASALQIDIDEVELWVVDAISNRLMEASMDQFKSEVQIAKVANRSFDASQWKNLQTRLREMKSNMASVFNTVKNAN